ncbi:hypothetical protein [Streptomyces hirsutus]|uniref:hypothetical protein n=1 Tax=Streptomyces hirsutus TaxID=35620 RepID=UPI003683530F
MSTNDKPVNGQHRPNSVLDLTELPPARKDRPRLARLRTAWKESWEAGDFLYQSWEEVFQGRHAGWHEIANFLQTSLCLMRQRGARSAARAPQPLE